jgi:hypothetical protein
MNLNGATIATGTFSSNNSNTRSILFGSGSIDLATTTAGLTNLDMANATGFTDTGTGGFTAAANVTRTYTFGTTGGTATNSPNLTLTGSGTAIQTFTTGSWFSTLSFGSTAFNPGTTALNLNGLTLSTTGTFSNLTPNMVGSGTITSNGNATLASLLINGSGITTTLGSALTLASTGTVTLTQGTLNLNGYNLTTGIFSSTNSNTRSITFGANNIVLVHTTVATTVLSMATSTNFTCTGTGGFTADASITRTYTVGSTTGNAGTAVNLTLTGSGTAIPTFTANSTFNSLNFGTTAFTLAATQIYVGTLTLSSSSDYTNFTPVFIRSQTWTSQYSKVLGGMGVGQAGVTLTLDGTQTFTATSTFVLLTGTLNLGGYNLTVGIFNGSGTEARSIVFGSNNIVLAHTSAATTVLAMANATGFTNTGTGGFTAAADITRTFTFGTTGGTAINSPKLAITGFGTAVQTIT